MSDTQQQTAQYTWSSGVPPVSAGTFQSDSRNWSGATELFFSDADSQAQALASTFAALKVEDTVRVEQGGNPGNWRLWRITAEATQEADLSWTVPVEKLDSGGTNVSNNQPCYVVFTMAATAGGSLADWTMEQADPSHWFSLVTCVHGTTRNGVWLLQPIQDDRNLEDQAASTFANHLALFQCDCVLNMAWTPSYAPPPAAEPTFDELAAQSGKAGVATFQTWGAYPLLYGGRVECSHGWAQSGAWRGAQGWPDVQALQDVIYQNHQRLFGCGDVLPAPASTAQLTLGAVTVARGVMQPLPEASANVSGPGFQWNGSRLSILQAGLYSVQGQVALARSDAGGFGHLLLQGQSFNRVPVSGGVASFNWSGWLPAGYTLRLAYENSTISIQDVQYGTLKGTSVTMGSPP